MELTFGQKAVGLNFNTSGYDAVTTCKQKFADIIDTLNDLRSNTAIDEVKRDIDSKSPKLNNKIEKAYEFIEKLSWEGISKTFIKAINKLVKE
jgi:hypothetical protein